MDVEVEDEKQAADRDKMINVYDERLSKARNEALKIENFINAIPDSEDRQIFEHRYIDGMKQREVGKLMNLERSTISKRLQKYLDESI